MMNGSAYYGAAPSPLMREAQQIQQQIPLATGARRAALMRRLAVLRRELKAEQQRPDVTPEPLLSPSSSPSSAVMAMASRGTPQAARRGSGVIKARAAEARRAQRAAAARARVAARTSPIPAAVLAQGGQVSPFPGVARKGSGRIRALARAERRREALQRARRREALQRAQTRASQVSVIDRYIALVTPLAQARVNAGVRLRMAAKIAMVKANVPARLRRLVFRGVMANLRRTRRPGRFFASWFSSKSGDNSSSSSSSSSAAAAASTPQASYLPNAIPNSQVPSGAFQVSPFASQGTAQEAPVEDELDELDELDDDLLMEEPQPLYKRPLVLAGAAAAAYYLYKRRKK